MLTTKQEAANEVDMLRETNLGSAGSGMKTSNLEAFARASLGRFHTNHGYRANAVPARRAASSSHAQRRANVVHRIYGRAAPRCATNGNRISGRDPRRNQTLRRRARLAQAISRTRRETRRVSATSSTGSWKFAPHSKKGNLCLQLNRNH